MQEGTCRPVNLPWGRRGRLVEELQLQQCLDEELVPALTSEGTTEIRASPVPPQSPSPMYEKETGERKGILATPHISL